MLVPRYKLSLCHTPIKPDLLGFPGIVVFVCVLRDHVIMRFASDSISYKPKNLTQPNILASWREIEALYESGKAHAIGVNNFLSKKLGDLLVVALVHPVVNQVECHPVWQQPKLHAFFQSKGVYLFVSMK